jgi:transposase
MLLRLLGKFQGQLTDQARFMSKADYTDKSKHLQELINNLQKQISAIDKKIDALIASDAELSRQHELLCSIDGVGRLIATKIIVVTNGFRNFENARQFECYIGVAPFEYLSGSSLHSKSKVSHKANKSIKSLLHMAALTAATRKKVGDLREYFERKVAEGKNKMAILNAIKGKIVKRMFAVIKGNRPYENNYKYKSKKHDEIF